MSDIKIVVGADVAQATSGLRAIQGELGKTAAVAKTSVSAFSSIGSSIGSLARSLISGGIITGIAVLGTALVSMFTKSAEAAEKSAKATAAAKKEYESIVGPIAKEAAQVEVLVESFSKENLSRQQKINIINDLKKLSPEYFGNLDKEKTSIDQLTIAYDAYARSALRSIEMRVKEVQLNKVVERRLELQDKGNKLTTTTIDENGKLIKTYNTIFDESGKAQKGFNQGLLLTQAEQTELNNLLKTEKELLRDIGSLRQPQDFNINTKPGKIKVELDIINTDHFSKFLGLDNKLTAGNLTIKPKVLVQPDIKIVPIGDGVLKQMAEWFSKEKLTAFQEEITARIQQTYLSIIEDSISIVTDSVADALTGGKNFLPNLFGGLIKGIGSQIKELGKYLVGVGIKMLAAKKAIQLLKFTPQTAIIAGAALQLLGGLLTSAATKKFNSTGFASGVRNFGGGAALVGERGPEMVYLPRGSSVQPNNQLNAYGGGPMVFIPDVTISGPNLVIAFNRALQQMNRAN